MEVRGVRRNNWLDEFFFCVSNTKPLSSCNIFFSSCAFSRVRVPAALLFFSVNFLKLLNNSVTNCNNFSCYLGQIKANNVKTKSLAFTRIVLLYFRCWEWLLRCLWNEIGKFEVPSEAVLCRPGFYGVPTPRSKRLWRSTFSHTQ